MEDPSLAMNLTVGANVDYMTMLNPHVDDPRYMQICHEMHCDMRYIIWCRCVRELGEDHPRCKFQYYRAQINCPSEKLDDWNGERERGVSRHDVDPDKLSRRNRHSHFHFSSISS
eukprot:Filipodium_phascolosomae@DN530_c0_g1_i2.p1